MKRMRTRTTLVTLVTELFCMTLHFMDDLTLFICYYNRTSTRMTEMALTIHHYTWHRYMDMQGSLSCFWNMGLSSMHKASATNLLYTVHRHAAISRSSRYCLGTERTCTYAEEII